MSNGNHAPVALPPGSYDAAALQQAFDAAGKLKPADRAEAVAAALDTLNIRPQADREARQTIAPPTRGAARKPANKKD